MDKSEFDGLCYAAKKGFDVLVQEYERMVLERTGIAMEMEYKLMFKYVGGSGKIEEDPMEQKPHFNYPINGNGNKNMN